MDLICMVLCCALTYRWAIDDGGAGGGRCASLHAIVTTTRGALQDEAS